MSQCMGGYMMEIDAGYLLTLESLISSVRLAGGEDVAIAGGAIRDMLFKKPVNDIDVFYVGTLDVGRLTTEFASVDATNIKYENTDFTLTHMCKYAKIPVHIQLIQVQDVKKTIEGFPTDIGRVYFDGEGLHNITPEVLYAYTHKMIFFDKKTTMKYYLKYVDKYTEYKLNFDQEQYKPPELKYEATDLNF